MGSRPGVSGRVGASKNGNHVRSGERPKPDAQAQKNGALRHRPATNGAVAVEPAIKLVGLAKSFGKRQVLKGVNFTIAPGELVEVTGPSGSGKTTLLRLVHGQLRPNAGEIWVRGRGLHRFWRGGLGGLRREVAFVFQEQRLLPRLNAFENIVFALQLRDPQVPNRTIKQRAMEALESVGLASRRKAYAHQLSAGERQRIAIARALATRPKVLLADEPLNSMDEENAAIITHLLEQAAANGTTVIVASHRHTFAATRVLRLPSERVMSNGAHRDAARGNGHAIVHLNGNRSGNGNPWCTRYAALFRPACAAAWLTEASPKLHTTTESGRQVDSTPSFRARSIANAIPTARGRCDAIVDVCGMTASAWLPKTLCRPPAIGSAAAAVTPRRMSGTPSRPACSARAR